MSINLSNLSDETKIINESGFLLQTVAETKEDILERGEHHHEDTWFLFLHEDVFGDEVEIDILPACFNGFFKFDRSELVAIKDNILHAKMHGHKLTEIEKGILEKIDLAFQQLEE
ncbi:hypothetical protein M5E02_14440 [Bacillus safensis]|uniref:hypothetical protein n=1 Tax=Bacillus safensis TaxID=561879 RepID=UPI002075758F|nr:hypothetical protein [Bacillus safensis]USD81952.1 hypothetical protein M5E02_14440 [Bacillus safensis]